MIIFNTTFSISPRVEQNFLAWMRQSCVSSLQECDYIGGLRFLKVHTQDPETCTYSLQVELPSHDKVATFQEDYFIDVKQSLLETFGVEALPFSTVLEECDL